MPDLTLEAFEDTPRDRLKELLRQEAKMVLGRLPAPTVTESGTCMRLRRIPAFGGHPGLLAATAEKR
jgi:hypothetical protein